MTKKCGYLLYLVYRHFFFKQGAWRAVKTRACLLRFFRSEDVRKPNITNSATVQQLRRVQGSSVEAKLRAGGIHVLHARDQNQRARRTRLTLRRSLPTGHFAKRFVHEIRSNEPPCSLSYEFDKQLGATPSHWLVTFSPNNHTAKQSLCLKTALTQSWRHISPLTNKVRARLVALVTKRESYLVRIVHRYFIQ